MSVGQNSDVMFRRFLERISDCAIFVLDGGGRVGSWNDGARAIIGYEPGEIVGRHFSVFYPQDARAAGLPEQALASALELGRFESEGWQVRKDGSVFWAATTVTAIVDDDGHVTGFGSMTRDLTERLAAEEQKAHVMAMLEKTAGTDFLTGAANRRLLDATLITSMASAKRHTRPLSVAMLDIDHFKSFNDTKGHQAGDLYLKEAIGCWRQVLRTECLLARYGGEEFTIIMPDTTRAQALESMQRVRKATPSPNTCSIGIAEWNMEDSADALLHRADRELYVAKRAGRNRVEAGFAEDRRDTPLPVPPLACDPPAIQRKSA